MTSNQAQDITAPGDPIHHRPGLTARVFKGSLWTLSGQILPLAVTFVTTPIVIRMLGAEGYGVVILTILIPQYLYFTDLGMVMASTKFASSAFAAGDADGEARIVRTAALIAFIGSIPAAILLFVFARQIGEALGVPPRLSLDAAIAIKFSSGTLVLTLLGMVVNSPLLSRLRMDLTTFSSAGSRVAGILGVPLAIYFGFGIAGASCVLFIAALLNLIGQFALSRRLLPQLIDLTIDRGAMRELLRFGVPMSVAAIAAIGLSNLEKGTLSAFSSVKELAYYSVAFSLAGIMVFFSTSMMQSLIPAFSQLQGEAGRDQMQKLYSRSVRLMLIWIGPVLVVIAVLARPFFTLWAGPDFGRESVLPLHLLLVGLAFNLVAYTPSSAILASGRTDLIARLYWIELIPYAALVYFLVGRYGGAGAAAAWSTRVIADSIAQFALAGRVTGVALIGIRPVAFGIATAIILTPLAVYLILDPNWIITATLIFACLTAYSFVVWKALIEPDEAKWLRRSFRSRFLIERTP